MANKIPVSMGVHALRCIRGFVLRYCLTNLIMTFNTLSSNKRIILIGYIIRVSMRDSMMFTKHINVSKQTLTAQFKQID